MCDTSELITDSLIYDKNISIQQAELNYLEAIDIIDNMNIEYMYPRAALRWYSRYILFLLFKGRIFTSFSMFLKYGKFSDFTKWLYPKSK